MIGKIYYDTNSLEIRWFHIQHPALGEVLTGLKIAFLSDLHAKRISSREKKILEILEKEKPDLIFLGGDYISFRGSYEPVMSFFHGLKNAYGVLGNTEYSNENGSCILCHEEKSKALKNKATPVILRNSANPLQYNGKIVNLIGLDDPVDKKDDLKAAIQRIDPSAPTILLSHSPEIFEEATKQGIDFVACGHNHGGQIFLTRYLRKMIPSDPALEYLEGFFQNGKTLMYVSRGIGTSFLPFRLGVKPEITFFNFSTVKSSSPNNSMITNAEAKIVFSGFSFSNFFNIFSFFESSARVKAHASLFDFESEADLDHLDWECHKWFELSKQHVTRGKYSLRMELPPGQYPGIHFLDFPEDWSNGQSLRMEVFNPSAEKISFHIRIDDQNSGWDYENRFDKNFELKEGMNHISVPLGSLKTNLHFQPLDLKNIKRFMVFVPDNRMKRELFLDNIRLE